MKNFVRSLRFLLPYKGRLILSLLCVFGITVLWAGGLGLLAPGSQVLVGEQGIHGWAFIKIAGGRMGGSVNVRLTPSNTPPLDGKALVEIVDVVSASKEGPAYQAGIRKGDWIVGLADRVPNDAIMRGQKLIQIIADAQAGEKLTLRVLNPTSREVRALPVTFAKSPWTSRVLGTVIGWIPESASRYQIFIGLLVIVILTTLLRNVLRFAQEYLVQAAVNRSIMDIRCENYSMVLQMPTVYFSVHGTTDMMSRFVQDTNELRQGQITLFGKTLAEPGKAIGSVAMAAFFSWKLTLVTLLVGPPCYWLIRKFGKKMKRAAKKMLESWSDMVAVLEETLTGIRVVKAYTMEGAERKRFFRVNRGLLRQYNKIAKLDAAIAPTIECLGVIGACVAASVAGSWVVSGEMAPENFIAFLACMAAIFDPIRKLSKVSTRFQRSEAAATRIFEVADMEREKTVPGAPKLPRHTESIEFRGVNFRYPNTVEDTLHDINLKIRAGQSVAIVGPNGSGKTTLVSLLPRLLEASSGEILIDGHDIANVSTRSLRRQIGLVSQETVLFHATIGENISYGLRRAKPEAVLAASKQAFVDEFVRDLPDGYDTMVGEKGATLSGGQRQRITIARAILRDPSILIFDEAMSQVDADSEKRISQAMEGFCVGRTTLLIAHRFQTVVSADMIVVMDGGRIVATGTHAELLESCKLYKHLFDTQFAGG